MASDHNPVRIAAGFSLLVLNATNRVPIILVFGEPVRIVVASVQTHDFRAAAFVLSRTPEICVDALVVV